MHKIENEIINAKKNILFILPVATQPRYSKRIQHYLDIGYKVTVASFERDYFHKNKLPLGIKYISLGQLKQGKYLRRLPKLLTARLKLRKVIRCNNYIYVFSPDLLIFLLNTIKRKEVYYEIGDIREINTNKYVKKIFNIIYKRALDNCKYIFVTSEAFKRYLIKTLSLEQSNIYIIENKLQKNFFNIKKRPDKRNITSNSFIIGIIGLMRYKNILDFLEFYSQKNYPFTIKIFGDGPLMDIIKKKYVDGNKVKYYGQFRYPDDLFSIYEQIDISFTMYDSDDLNVRLALPNKLYESMYFYKPIIVSKRTFLAKKVKEFNIGFAWDQKEMILLLNFLNSPKFISRYNFLVKNIATIEDNEFIT